MKRPFKVGDAVRFVRLDGTVSGPVVVIHDRWGTDDQPRNVSFMTGFHEQTTHTDLIKHEDDSAPVVVPDGGEWFIARGSNMGWGRAQTAEAAIANMRRQGGTVDGYVVHRVSKWTRVDDMGSLSYPEGIDPVEVKRVEPKKKRA